MRVYREATHMNFLREPLVLGVPLIGLVMLCLGVLVLEILLGTTKNGSFVILGIATTSYLAMRLMSRFVRPGWEEAALFFIERLAHRKKKPSGFLKIKPSRHTSFSPDTLDEYDLITAKNEVLQRLISLRRGERLTWLTDIYETGAVIHEVDEQPAPITSMAALCRYSRERFDKRQHVYSLYRLPPITDPMWLHSVLFGVSGNVDVITSVRGVDSAKIKSRIATARRRNARVHAVSDVDSDVTFEEASQVLEGIARGTEKIVQLSVVVVSEKSLDLDPHYFVKEKRPLLAVLSVVGLRARFHRSHYVRAITATDLVHNICDPDEDTAAILKTLRGFPLYFDPQDRRLESLHWLVVGASGSGKSFCTGLILKRLIEGGAPMSVLFVDHNRSFRRIVKKRRSKYLEPISGDELATGIPSVLRELEREGAMCGMELSDLPFNEKKAAVHLVLKEIEAFLRSRDTVHPVYIVLDECWNFMRDEPVLVQRAFREFRKLNGAAVAITQSLSDFITDESGQSIFQNAPIRILLRQGEDLTPFKRVLGLNEVELNKARFLRQEKGVFSECLIKTPFCSKMGRLYPSAEEHDELRSDNIRSEMIAAKKAVRAEVRVCSAR